jgi:hypothetical protein
MLLGITIIAPDIPPEKVMVSPGLTVTIVEVRVIIVTVPLVWNRSVRVWPVGRDIEAGVVK